MTTQEKLEAFAPYYMHKLKCLYKDEIKIEIVNGVSYEKAVIHTNNGSGFIDSYKFIFRPLSDLTKPCLEDGKVPIVKLANISYPDEIWNLDEHNNCVGAKDRYIFAYEYNEYSFTLDTITDYAAPLNQLQLFQQLYKWHFWLGAQSEFGKSIIDINTVKTE